jgi:hypothetical protein
MATGRIGRGEGAEMPRSPGTDVFTEGVRKSYHAPRGSTASGHRVALRGSFSLRVAVVVVAPPIYPGDEGDRRRFRRRRYRRGGNLDELDWR